jgi:hypothetical protein
MTFGGGEAIWIASGAFNDVPGWHQGDGPFPVLVKEKMGAQFSPGPAG